MESNLIKAIKQLSAREGYYLPLVKANLFKDIEKNTKKVHLAQLLTEHKNGTWGKESLKDGLEVKVLRSPDIRFGFIDSKNAEKRYISKSDYEKHKLKSGDILVIKSNGSQDLVGKSQIFNVEEDNIIPSNFVMRLRPNLDLIDVNYLDLFLKSPQSLMWRFENQTTSTGLRNLKTKEYLATLIPLPSIETQKFIVKYFNECSEGKFRVNDIFLSDKYKRIYTLVSEHNLLEKNIKRQNEIVQKLKTIVVDEAIQGKLISKQENTESIHVNHEIMKKETAHLIKEKKKNNTNFVSESTEQNKPFSLPSSWEWKRLGDITTIKGGKRLPSGHQLTPIPTEHIYIRVTDMKNNTISSNDLRYITEEVYQQISSYIIKKEDLYITIVGSTIGKVGIVPEKFDNSNLTENAARIILHTVDKHYLLYVLTSNFVQGQFVDKTKQVGQPKLALSRLKNTLIPLPPLDVQKKIVEKLTHIVDLCNALENNIKQTKCDSINLMESILEDDFVS